MVKYLFLLFCLLPISVSAGQIDDIYFIDAHSQIDKWISIQSVIKLMDRYGVCRTLLATRRGRKPIEVLEYASKYKGRIIPILATKQYGYISDQEKNRRNFFSKLNKFSALDYRGLGEVLMWHSGCPNDKCPSVRRDHSDERVRAILSVAKKHNWPFIAHIEFKSLDSSAYASFMFGLKKLLNEYRDIPFVLIHMGQLEASEARLLVAEHKNVHFLTSHSNPVAVRMGRGAKPWVNMFDGDRLSDKWRNLIVDYPDRFIFALDNVWGQKHWQNHVYKKQMRYWRKALTSLPADVAHAIAHGNAERLWRLRPNCQ